MEINKKQKIEIYYINKKLEINNFTKLNIKYINNIKSKTFVVNNNIYKVDIKNKPDHIIFKVQKELEILYINKYSLIKNICSKDRSGYKLISLNNKHYEKIIN